MRPRSLIVTGPRRARLGAVAFGLVACSSERPGVNVRRAVDAATDRADASVPTGVDGGLRPLPPWPTCEAGPYLDVATAGVRFGAYTRVRVEPDDPRATAARLGPSACEPTEEFRPQILRYTMREAGALSLSTGGLGSPFWAATGCLDTARVLACSAGVTSQASSREWIAPLVLRGLGAGATVFVFVRPRRQAFEVGFTEYAERIAVGERCDGGASTCVLGASCTVAYVGGERVSRCVPDGSLGAACRATAPKCDEGLACSEPQDIGGGTCSQVAPPDRDCSVWGDRSPRQCAEGDCVTTPMGWRCAALGTLHARCRAGATPCDAGLVCTRGTISAVQSCEVPLPSGSSCYPNHTFGACPRGEWCATPPGETRCAPAGGAYLPCRDTTPACDAGLACQSSFWNWRGICFPSAPTGAGRACDAETPCPVNLSCLPLNAPQRTCQITGVRGAPCWGFCTDGTVCAGQATGALAVGTCVTPAAPGAPCTPVSDAFRSCVVGATCVASAGGAATCVPDGADGTRCRRPGAPCDAGLLCGVDGYCRPPAATNEFCVGRHCVGGERCATTCRPAGTEAGNCRAAAPRCDAGLVCHYTATESLCVRPLALGQPCASMSLYDTPCEPGARCSDARCVANDPTFVACRYGADGVGRCDGGRVCSASYGCVPTAPEGAPCLDRASGQRYACLGTSHCRRLGSGQERCVSPGAYGGACRAVGEPCDAGLDCLRAPQVCWNPDQPCSVYSTCVERVATGSPCEYNFTDRLCAEDATCDALVCVASGARGARCRRGLRPCDGSLVCRQRTEYERRCEDGGGPDAPCGAVSAPPCASPLECVAGACAPPTYEVTVRREVALDDPCDGPLRGPYADGLYRAPPPFPFTFFGRAVERVVPRYYQHTVVLAAAADADWLDRAFPSPASQVVPLAGLTPGGPGIPTVHCIKVVGAAPRRRLVIERRHVTLEPAPLLLGDLHGWVGAYQVILHEGYNVVDVAYRGFESIDGTPRTATLAPRIELGARVVVAPVTEVTAGTVIRFTPR